MNKTAIVIGGGILTTPICEELRMLGVEPVVFDADPNCHAARAGFSGVAISTRDVAGAVYEAKHLANERNVVGVTTCGADVEVTVAAIAEELGLRGISSEVARRCHDKAAMRCHLAGSRFQLDGCHVMDGTTIRAWVKRRNQWWRRPSGPLAPVNQIVKPIKACGSRGVIRVRQGGDLISAYASALKWSDGNDDLLIEPLLEGSFHTVEGFTKRHADNGVVMAEVDFTVSIIDTHYLPNAPCETGLNTTLLDKAQQDELSRFAMGVKDLIGIDEGPWKVDICLTDDGPKLIELTARLSGGFHCQFASRAAYGTNEIRATAAWACGMDGKPAWLTHQYERGAAVRAAFPAPGRVKRIDTSRAEQCHGVERVVVLCKEGDVIGPYENSADRVAFVLVSADTTEQAIAWADYAAGCVDIETEPICPKCGEQMHVQRESRDEPESRQCACGFEWTGFHPRSLLMEERY